jgi:hypothetical protein
VLQSVVPVWQALPPGVHAAPVEHATQLPLSQTWFVPHGVPFDTMPV